MNNDAMAPANRERLNKVLAELYERGRADGFSDGFWFGIAVTVAVVIPVASVIAGVFFITGN